MLFFLPILNQLTLALPPIHPIPGFSEPVSSLSHLIAAAIFAALTIPMLRKAAGHPGRIIAIFVFAFSVVFLFSMSGVYHLLTPETAGRAVLQRLDHAAIFVLIAGSFTAAHAILFKGFLRWGIITLLWVLTATAIPLKTVFFESMSESLSLALYIGMGWIGLLSGILVYKRFGLRFMLPLLLGGLAYTFGAILEFLRAPNPIPAVVHTHELFHLFVILGVALHWRFTWHFANGKLPKPRMSQQQALHELQATHKPHDSNNHSAS